MFLDLTEIAEEPGKRWTIPIDFPPTPTADLDFTGAAAGRVVVYNTGSSLLFSGSVTAALGRPVRGVWSRSTYPCTGGSKQLFR